MHLLNTATFELFEWKEFFDDEIPPYAILSHTWTRDEVSFRDIQELAVAKTKLGFTKTKGCCKEARKVSTGKLDWAWIGTCCI
jgi:hypothetical protein